MGLWPVNMSTPHTQMPELLNNLNRRIEKLERGEQAAFREERRNWKFKLDKGEWVKAHQFKPGDRVRADGCPGYVGERLVVELDSGGMLIRSPDSLIPIRTTSEPYKPPTPPWIRGLKRIRAGEASFSLARKLKERKGEMRLEE